MHWYKITARDAVGESRAMVGSSGSSSGASDSHTPRGPGSTSHSPQSCALVPDLSPAPASAAIYCTGMSRNTVSADTPLPHATAITAISHRIAPSCPTRPILPHSHPPRAPFTQR